MNTMKQNECEHFSTSSPTCSTRNEIEWRSEVKKKSHNREHNSNINEPTDQTDVPVGNTHQNSPLVPHELLQSQNASYFINKEVNSDNLKRANHNLPMQVSHGIVQPRCCFSFHQLVDSMCCNRWNMKRQWMNQLTAAEECGLAFLSAKEQISKIPPHVISRLDERWKREQTVSNDNSKGSSLFHTFMERASIPDDNYLPLTDKLDEIESSEDKNRYQPNEQTDIARLNIIIHQIILEDHTTFTLEQKLLTRLQSQYIIYRKLLQREPWTQMLQYLKYKKLKSIKIEGLSVFSGRNEMALVYCVSEATNALEKLQTLHNALVSTWEEIQACSRYENISKSPFPDSVYPHVNFQVVKRENDIDLNDLQQYLQVQEGIYMEEKKKFCTTTLLQQKDRTCCGEKLEADIDGKEQHNNMVKREKIIKQIQRLFCGTTSNACFSNVIIMTESAETSIDKQYNSLSRPLYFVVLCINNREIARTKSKSPTRWNQIIFKQRFQVELRHIPSIVSILVYESKYMLQRLISSTYIPLLIPGLEGLKHSTNTKVNAVGLSPNIEWYQFCDNHNIAKKHWHSSFLHSSTTISSRQIQGRILVETSWSSPNTSPFTERSRQCFLPSMGLVPFFKNQDHLKHNQRFIPIVTLNWKKSKLEGSKPFNSKMSRNSLHSDNANHGIIYEQSFLRQMKEHNTCYNLDERDPINYSITQVMDNLEWQSLNSFPRKVFRTNSLLLSSDLQLVPLKNSLNTTQYLTKRNYLLQTRYSQAQDKANQAHNNDSRISTNTSNNMTWLLETPIPFSESEINDNSQFSTILYQEAQKFDQQLKAEDLDKESKYSVQWFCKRHELKQCEFVSAVNRSRFARTGYNAQKDSIVMSRSNIPLLSSIIYKKPMPSFSLFAPSESTFDYMEFLRKYFPITPIISCLTPIHQCFGMYAKDIGHCIQGCAPSRLLSIYNRYQRRKRRFRPKILQAKETPNNCEIHIQIQSAKNVPIRIRGQTISKRQERRSKNKRKSHVENEDIITKYESNYYVEVFFQGQRRRTSCSPVCLSIRDNSKSHVSNLFNESNPLWMETLVISFTPPNNSWSPKALQTIQDTIQIRIFDQVEIGNCSDIDENTEEETNFLSSYQMSNYVCGLEIPFTTLFHFHDVLETTLCCDVPPLQYGYTILSSNNHDQHDIENNIDNINSASTSSALNQVLNNNSQASGIAAVEPTMLDIMMTLDPILPVPNNECPYKSVPKLKSRAKGGVYISNKVEGRIPTEMSRKDFVKYANEWKSRLNKLNTSTKNRDYNVLVNTLCISHKTFLTQFLAMQVPPTPLCSGVLSSHKTLAYYIKRIPFLDDFNVLSGDWDHWSTSQEFLSFNAGDYEEHAILLCNFYNYVDKHESKYVRSYLVIGDAIPEGKCVYVLRQCRENSSTNSIKSSILWDASRGKRYSVVDPHNTIKDISLIVSQDNIYANIQKADSLLQMNWYIENNPSAWWPFFTESKTSLPNQKLPSTIDRESVLHLIPCIQVSNLHYEITPSELTINIAHEVRDTLKMEIRRLRLPKSTTKFNLEISLKLQQDLECLEMQESGWIDSSKSINTFNDYTDVSHIGKSLQNDWEVSGVPFATTFTTLDKIITMVIQSKIHENTHPMVEFALGIYARGYPNCVVSLRVYFISLIPKNYK